MSGNEPARRAQHLYTLPGYEEVTTRNSDDQVPRLRRFRTEHPEIEIVPPNVFTGGYWIARNQGDNKQIASSWELSDLLDILEQYVRGKENNS